MTAEEIENAVQSAGLKPLAPGVAAKFATYLELLLKWNAKLNLTAVREPAEIVRRHFLECIQCAQVLPKAATLFDFGSGGGFPGIPIALVCPEVKVIMGESQAKKASFLREAVRTLRLDASVYDGRIESMMYEHKFDIVTLRAVDRMAEACTLGLKWLKERGTLVVFATRMTEPAIRQATGAMDWEQNIPAVGLSDGYLMLGRRETK